MMFIIGLGNIGAEYNHTRHNIGFEFINSLANKWKKYNDYEICDIKINDYDVTLVKPSLYVNNSGKALCSLISKDEYFIVIHDDIELALGKIKLSKGTSHKGHNGLKDIYKYYNKDHIYRVRIGIGKDHNNISDYVLGKFSISERKILEDKFIQVEDLVNEALNEISSVLSD